MGFYRAAKASEYIVIAGHGINHINLAKKSLISGKSSTLFDYSPVNYTVKVAAVTARKQPFIVHTVFTIGYAGDDSDSLLNNAKLLGTHRLQSDYVKQLVHDIVVEVIRVLVDLMSMEDVFNDMKGFKRRAVDGIQMELALFGLRIYNADIELPVMSGDVKINVFEDSVNCLGYLDAENERQRKKRKLMWGLVEDSGDEINTELAYSRKRHPQSNLAEVVVKLKNASTQTQCLVAE